MAAVRISSRSGLPSLLLYLGIGIALGQDGIFDVKFDNAELTQVIGYAALVVILAEGGLGAKWKEVRPVLPAAAVVSTVGVGISVGITAAAAHYLVGLDWRQALIIGAVVSSTDAAAVFSVLRRVPLPSRITGVLEAESGFNDAPVVILVVAFSAVGPVEHWYLLIGEIALELAIGAAIGITVGWLGSLGLRHVALPASGLYPIAVMAIAVMAYAAGAMAHGSGFLAVYLAAMILGNSKLPHWPATRGFADGLGWLAQIGMFVLLGLLVTPHDLVDDFWPAMVVGLVLTMVARPLSVFLSLAPFRLLLPREGPDVVGRAARGRAHHPGDHSDGLRGGGQHQDLQHRLRPRDRLHADPGPDPAVGRGQAEDRRRARAGRPGHRVRTAGAAARPPAVGRHPRQVQDARRRGR